MELPEGLARPQLGPIATGLGEVFHYVVRSTDTNRTPTELRTLQDWVVKPELRKVPGVAEVNTWGGFEKQYHVVVETDRLIKYRLTFEELVEALQANNQNVGGGQIVRGGESLLVHGVGLTTNVQEIANIVITSHDGTPVRVRDVATVKEDHEIRRGAVTADGRGEAVLGLGFMLMGENSAVVTRALKAKLAEVQKFLPPDVKLEVLYDRTELVDNVIRTVEHNLLAGALLVIAILFAFLGNLRAGLIVAVAIPLSMLFAGNFMLQAGIAASLLSLGAVDFGLIVDGAVVMVENAMRRLAVRQHELGRALTKEEREEVLRSAPLEVARPVAFGVGIIMIVFLPILTLEGIEGKLFKPMALTLIFALLGSLILALTLTPVLASLFLPKQVKETGAVAGAAGAPHLRTGAGTSRCGFGSSRCSGRWRCSSARCCSPSRMGGEFLPKLGEGAIVGTTVRLAGISVEEAVAQNDRIEQVLMAEFPDEIEHIWTRLGTAESGHRSDGCRVGGFLPRAETARAVDEGAHASGVDREDARRVEPGAGTEAGLQPAHRDAAERTHRRHPGRHRHQGLWRRSGGIAPVGRRGASGAGRDSRRERSLGRAVDRADLPASARGPAGHRPLRRADAQRAERRRGGRLAAGGRRARRPAAFPAGGAIAGPAAHGSGRAGRDAHSHGRRPGVAAESGGDDHARWKVRPPSTASGASGESPCNATCAGGT